MDKKRVRRLIQGILTSPEAGGVSHVEENEGGEEKPDPQKVIESVDVTTETIYFPGSDGGVDVYVVKLPDWVRLGTDYEGGDHPIATRRDSTTAKELVRSVLPMSGGFVVEEDLSFPNLDVQSEYVTREKHERETFHRVVWERPYGIGGSPPWYMRKAKPTTEWSSEEPKFLTHPDGESEDGPPTCHICGREMETTKYDAPEAGFRDYVCNHED